MFGAAQIQSFAATVSSARLSAFGCPMTFRGQSITGLCTTIKTGSKLQEAGFMFSHDAIARIPLAAVTSPPLVGDQLRVFLPGGPKAGQPLRIQEVLTHPQNPEYRLGLMAL